MPVTKFPDPKSAGFDGILALGGDLHPETLILAYTQGIFPWPIPGEPLAWFCPAERGILDFGGLHIPKTLAQKRRNTKLRITIDADFPAVIRECARSPRPDQHGTWITPRMQKAYHELHALGLAHSCETWDPAGNLVGGLYGVSIGGTFAGESMFHREADASKLALLHLIDHLRSKGLDWIDIQVMTPHMERLGARLIPRDEFLEKLARTQRRGLALF